MNEEIEYAEMLEIPVSTVNVVRKKRRKHTEEPSPRHEKRRAKEDTFLKESVIAQVNEQLQDALQETHTENSAEQIVADAELFAESANSQGYLSFEPDHERMDTVRLYAADEIPLSDDENSLYDSQNDGGRYEMNKKHSRVFRAVLHTEFALACALCGAIFFTNVFLPNSAMNNFFRSIHTPVTEAASQERHYSDFELAPIVSSFSEAELNLSPSGVLTFQDDCHVYPAANGEICEILQTAEGLYTVKVSYTDSFSGVFNGLNQVYYAVGDEVKANVPVGYTAGEAEVQITMYASGTLLNCFELTEENCLAWVDATEE
ncbi:MAG: hypothetical protein IJV83_05490 [Clostridia bacterium]|nr:hypothetical protein [Clostridia bacterium]MBQ9714756.1 hypothetical protein [Clostridia bacterium]